MGTCGIFFRESDLFESHARVWIYIGEWIREAIVASLGGKDVASY